MCVRYELSALASPIVLKSCNESLQTPIMTPSPSVSLFKGLLPSSVSNLIDCQDCVLSMDVVQRIRRSVKIESMLLVTSADENTFIVFTSLVE